MKPALTFSKFNLTDALSNIQSNGYLVPEDIYDIIYNSDKSLAAIVLVFLKLKRICGGDISAANQWISSFNSDLQYCPIDHLNTKEGIDDILHYLDRFIR